MMRLRHVLLVLCAWPAILLAQGSLAGDWQLTRDVYGNPQHLRLTLNVDGSTLSGTLGQRAIEGSVADGSIRFTIKSPESTETYAATLAGDTMSGTLVRESSDDPNPLRSSWSARRIPPKRSGPAQRHEYVPTVFHRQFSAAIEPALRIWPGDTVHTTTVDAGGADEKGVTRGLGGNPQTGPFYVETAMPGDVLVVRLNRIRLNRDWAISDDGIVSRALDPDLAVRMKDGFKPVRWRLDRERGLAMPEKPSERLARFTVPV